MHFIEPRTFVDTMRNRWTDELKNVSNPRLERLWLTMAETFNAAIRGFDQGDTTWRFLQPPTGTGKTQGAAVFAALAAQRNRELDNKLGLLIVTRTIQQADEMVETVNAIAGFPCCIATHSEAKQDPLVYQGFPVLVITHAAYVLALETETLSGSYRWDNFISWQGGKRKLTIIDEAITNIIEEHQLREADVKKVVAAIFENTKKLFPDEWEAIDGFQQILSQVSTIVHQRGNDTDDDVKSKRVVWKGKTKMPERFKMDRLRAHMATLRFDVLLQYRKDDEFNRQYAECVDKTLKAIEIVFSRWAYFAKVGDWNTFNVARFLVPDNLPGPVVLDATSQHNFLRELMETKAYQTQKIPGARSYANVTLHVAYAGNTGKGAMMEKGDTRVPRLIRHLKEKLGTDKKVFVCCHKAIEHKFALYNDHELNEFNEFSVGHWGAVDGKNDWKEFDVAVIFGMPNRNDIWADNTFFALQGLQPDSFFENPAWKDHRDVRMALAVNQLTVDIIQAVNRIRCRKVVDEQGNCEPCDIFIVLPLGEKGKQILHNLRTEMEGIEVQPWKFNMDGEKAQLKKGSSHEALLTFMVGMPPGKVYMSTVKTELELSDGGMKHLRASLRDPGDPLAKALFGNGVVYVVEGQKRGAKGYLLKSA